jgi:predicted metal-dependent HD superfamily phosphohydrolase
MGKNYSWCSYDVSEPLGEEYFLNKFKQCKTKIVDMSDTVFKLLLAAYKVWDLHYRHKPHAMPCVSIGATQKMAISI